MLRRKRVEPAVHEEVLVVVRAVTLNAKSLRNEVMSRDLAGGPVLRTSHSAVWTRGKRLDHVLEVTAPLHSLSGVDDGKVNVLESVVGIVFAVELVLDGLEMTLTRSAKAKVPDVPTVNEGVGALPVTTDLAHSL